MDQCYINLVVLEPPREDFAQQPGNKQTECLPSEFTLFTRLGVEASNMGNEVPLPELFSDRKRRDGSTARLRRILIRGRAVWERQHCAKRSFMIFCIIRCGQKFLTGSLGYLCEASRGDPAWGSCLAKNTFQCTWTVNA